MTDLNCGNCQHWQPPDPDLFWDLTGTVFGKCTAVLQAWDIRAWNDETGDDEIMPEYSHLTAVAQDGSSYAASLRTKAEHYCSMHRPQEQKA